MQRVTVLPVGAFRLSPKQHYGTVCLCILFIRERQHDGTSSYGHLRYKTGTSDFSKNWSALPGVLAQAGAGATERRCHRAAGWLRIMGSARNRRRKLDGVCSWCGRGSSKHSASTTTRQDIHCEELVDVVRKRGFGHSGGSLVNELRANTPNQSNESYRNFASRYKTGTANRGRKSELILRALASNRTR